jgi:hypothetical protein
MEKAVWTVLFVAVAGTGIAIAVAHRSRMWTATGIALALGGAGIAFYIAFLPDPAVGTMTDIASWAAVVGFFCLVIAAVLILVAIGSHGRRRFLVVLAAATLGIGTYLFWTANWPARFGDVPTRCADTGHAFRPPGHVQRIPPGFRCYDDVALVHGRTVPRESVLVRPDAISWLALAGWSFYYAFAISFPLMGLAWLFQRRSASRRPLGLTG